ncbi:MAG: sigma-70 family RNA polymerase sigma factor [Deltaproteobacteria bacterium]|nr:sigma-70 family RNA polymerase sigma factor [Deltaproteobacteria bacterium]
MASSGKKSTRPARPPQSSPQSKAEREQAHHAELERHRNELVKQYFPYATSIANRVSQSLSADVDYDDVLCNARLGLLEAAKRFDETQDVDFRTFAYYRIKGAIYDGLRKSGWIPRSLYAKLKFEEAANDYMRQKSIQQSIPVDGTSSPPDEEEQITQTVNSLASIYVISLDANEDLDVEDENHVDVEQRAALHQIRNHMREAISALPPKEKQLIMMYYFQNRTLEEAGARLHLSKSWTSRLHARALEMLMKHVRQRTKDTNEEVRLHDRVDGGKR